MEKFSFHGFLVMRIWYRFLKTLRNNPEMDDKTSATDSSEKIKGREMAKVNGSQGTESPVLKLKELRQY